MFVVCPCQPGSELVCHLTLSLHVGRISPLWSVRCAYTCRNSEFYAEIWVCMP